jgi:mono/diheme cytochrome c family protein
MTVRIAVTALVLAIAAQGAAAADIELNDTQRLGRQLVDQHYGVCHPPDIGLRHVWSGTRGETAGGRQEIVRDIVADGTPRMPGFKYMFNAEQIAAIASYLSVLPPGHQVVNLPPK